MEVMYDSPYRFLFNFVKFIKSIPYVKNYLLPFQLPFTFIDILPTFLPVSYTHLDVYKRQV